MVRIYFKDKNIRNKFFKDLIRCSNLKTWKELRNKFNIPRTNLENYKNGKLTIPKNVYDNFNLFPVPNPVRVPDMVPLSDVLSF